MKLTYRRVLGAVMVAASAIAVSGCDLPYTPENQFPFLANSARSAAGLGSLSVNPPGGADLANRARQHSADMCAAHNIFHVDNLQAFYQPTGAWLGMAENVGVIGWDQNNQASWQASTDALWTAFMNSQTHRDHILDPHFNNDIVGQYVCSDGEIYVTHLFFWYL